MTYQPKGKTAAERAFKKNRAEGHAIRNAERRAKGEQLKSPSANRKRKGHGR